MCWKFEGRKYEIAMNAETIVVNHRWIEECIKQGKRVPEDPYMLKWYVMYNKFLFDFNNLGKLSNA